MVNIVDTIFAPGDLMYTAVYGTVTAHEILLVNVYLSKEETTIHYTYDCGGTTDTFYKDAIGLTMFKTEEEAQQALKGFKGFKSYATDFFEKFPKAEPWQECKGKSCPRGCVADFYGGSHSDYGCDSKNCFECWNQPMPQETEEHGGQNE